MCPCDTNEKETGISGLFLYFHLVLRKLGHISISSISRSSSVCLSLKSRSLLNL
jgi:hypothetical protein